MIRKTKLLETNKKIYERGIFHAIFDVLNNYRK